MIRQFILEVGVVTLSMASPLFMAAVMGLVSQLVLIWLVVAFIVFLLVFCAFFGWLFVDFYLLGDL
jgi:hypothetical protein